MLAHPRIAVGLFLAALLADLAVWQLWQQGIDNLATVILTLALQTSQIGVLALIMLLPPRLTVARVFFCMLGILAFLMVLPEVVVLQGRMFAAGLVLALIGFRLGRQFRRWRHAHKSVPRAIFGLGTILLALAAVAAGLTIVGQFMEDQRFDPLLDVYFYLPLVIFQIASALTAAWATRAPTSLARIALPFGIAILISLAIRIAFGAGMDDMIWLLTVAGVLAATILTLSLHLIGFQYPTEPDPTEESDALTASTP